jgi:hypothetical protein
MSTPLAVARRQAATREKSTLEAALAVLDSATGHVMVAATDSMTADVFRQHCRLRHPGMAPRSGDHTFEHATIPGLCHSHLAEEE